MDFKIFGHNKMYWAIMISKISACWRKMWWIITEKTIGMTADAMVEVLVKSQWVNLAQIFRHSRTDKWFFVLQAKSSLVSFNLTVPH